MQKEQDFIENQKKIIALFRELKETTDKLFSRTVQLGWKQRNVLIDHVYSDYQKHHQLQFAKKEWEEVSAIHQFHKKLYDLFREYRDIYGYFPEYHKMKEQLEDLLQVATCREEYEFAGMLKSWITKIP